MQHNIQTHKKKKKQQQKT